MSWEYRQVLICDHCREDVEEFTFTKDNIDEPVAPESLKETGVSCHAEVNGAELEHVCKTCFKKLQEEGVLTGLTDEQVENWRNILLTMVGSYALVMPRKEVVKLKKRFQEIADEEGEKMERNERNGM